MKGTHKIAFWVLIVGGLNWLLLGLLGWEIGVLFGGADALISRVIYIIVGVAAVYEIFSHRKLCEECKVDKHEHIPGPITGMM